LAGVQEGLWRVYNGNFQVPKCLLRLSGATLTPAKVQSVEALDKGYRVQLQNQEKNSSETFDMVVLATPMTSTKKI